MTKQFKILKNKLSYEPPKSREDAFSLYGYYFACYVFDKITVEELEKLQEMLELTDEEIDNLSIV
ncbi:MAG: hypothetical protein H0Z28_11125 [Archaeoglobus sp.]|nr:hypothetical protein [Archaeoglobus sp.]